MLISVELDVNNIVWEDQTNKEIKKRDLIAKLNNEN